MNQIELIRRPETLHRIKDLSSFLNASVFVIACLVLLGWWQDIEVLIRPGKGTVAMNPLTAVSFILSSLSLWILHSESRARRMSFIGILIAILILLFGLYGTLATIVRFPVALDAILFSEKLWEEELGLTNRMAPNTGFIFILSALSLLLLNWESSKGRRPAQFLAIIISLSAILSLYGYVYGLKLLYSLSGIIPMAVHTAIAFLLFSASVLFSRPDRGTMGIIVSDSSFTSVLMRLLAFVLPLLGGWLQLEGERLKLYSNEFGTALFTVFTYAISMFLLGRHSVLEFQMEKQKMEHEQELEAILDNSETPIFIKSLEGKYLLVNKKFQNLFKVSEKEILGDSEMKIPISEWSRAYGDFLPDGVTPFPSEQLPLAKALRGISTNEVEIIVKNKTFPKGKRILVTGRSIKEDDGNVIGGVVNFRDLK
ncbi:MAG: PAS domain-containing protein [Bacteriovoracaceae bacterium]|nr:PAS domain-containing protein [Bacteriovoracaceae bacterium]